MALATSGKVSCKSGDPADCPPAVGMFVALSSSTRIKQCTAFLISSQIAVTSSDCIPEDLRSAGSSCANRVWIYFPDLTGYPQVRSACSKVLMASRLPKAPAVAPDYAVIRLETPVRRPPLQLSRDGFAEGKSFQIVKVDPRSTTSVDGVMGSTACRAIHDSAIIPDSGSDQSLNMAMGDCRIAQENSGSPILDVNGMVNGVIQPSFEKSALEGALHGLTLPLLDQQVGPLSAASNFACLNLPEEVPVPRLASQCAGLDSGSDSVGVNTQALMGKASTGLEDELARLSIRLNPAFKWRVTNYEAQDFDSPTPNPYQYSKHVFPVPDCIRDPNALLKGHGLWIGGYDSKATLELMLPKIEVQLGVNRYLAPDYHLEGNSGSISASLTYSPDQLDSQKASHIIMKETGLAGGDSMLFNQTIGLCAASQASNR